MERAAIYVRISSDATREGAGVARQESECRALAEREGLQVVRVFTDNDISAYSGARRPAFEDLLTCAEQGDYEVLLVWATDRLYRRVKDLTVITERLAGVRVLTVMGGEVDLSTSEGRLRAQVLGSVAEFESSRKAERIRSKWTQRAESGRALGSRRTFGWSWAYPCPAGDTCRHEPACEVPGLRPAVGTAGAGQVPDPIEGPLVAEAFRRVAAGASIRATRRWLAEQPGGRLMEPTPLARLLKNPRHAGLVVHRGEVVGEHADGHSVIDRETFEAVQLILRDPARRMAPGRPTITLFSGIVRCRCGAPMGGVAKNGRGYYGCRTGKHSYIRERAMVDGPMLDLLGEVVAGLQVAGALAVGPVDVDPTEHEARVLGARLEALAGLAASGALDPLDFAAASKAIRTELAALDVRRARGAARTANLSALDGWDRLVDRWRDDPNDVDDLRVAVAELVDFVDVLPAAVYRKPAPSDVRIEWAEWLPHRHLLPRAPR